MANQIIRFVKAHGFHEIADCGNGIVSFTIPTFDRRTGKTSFEIVEVTDMDSARAALGY